MYKVAIFGGFLRNQEENKMIYGYARVSTREQNEARQLESLRAAGCQKIFVDKCSGKNFERPEWNTLLSVLCAGDIVIAHSIDRLGRNYDDILAQWRHIVQDLGADIKILDMPLLDTTNHTDLTGHLISDIVLQLLSYVAQKERESIRQRQKEGIAIAKAAGKYLGGRKKNVDMLLFSQLLESFQKSELNKSQFAEKLGVSRPTLNKLLDEHAEKSKKS